MASFTNQQWKLINDWVRRHRALINVLGSEYAATVAARSTSSFPTYLAEDQWDILVGARPSAEQISESMRVQRLYSKRNFDGV